MLRKLPQLKKKKARPLQALQAELALVRAHPTRILLKKKMKKDLQDSNRPVLPKESRALEEQVLAMGHIEERVFVFVLVVCPINSFFSFKIS